MNSLRFSLDAHQVNLYDTTFNRHIFSLKVINFISIIGMNQFLWKNVHLSKKNMTSVLILGSGINFLKEVMMTLCVQSF